MSEFRKHLSLTRATSRATGWKPGETVYGHVVFLLLLLALLAFPHHSFSAGSKIEETCQKAADSGFSGVVLLARNDEVLFEKAMGYRCYEKQVPIETSDIFEMASVSKQFTAMMVMMCKEKGLLGFDDPVENYIDLPYKGVRIRHLLTHTSGLPDYQRVMDEHWDKSKVAGNPEILEYLCKHEPPVLFQPGEKYKYSNTGYVLLASIVEKCTGKDFVTLSRDWIFDPLGMGATDIRSLEAKAKVNGFAAGHLKQENGGYVNAGKFRASDYTVWLGNRKGPGRVSSRARDLLLWDQALYSKKLVSEETLKEAFSPCILKDGTVSSYGFGWYLASNSAAGNVVSHTGSNPGYKTVIVRYIDQKKTLIVLNNNAHEGMDDLVKTLKEILEAL
jgi:CubicO group peptidase (beta-lactamase class C family)